MKCHCRAIFYPRFLPCLARYVTILKGKAKFEVTMPSWHVIYIWIVCQLLVQWTQLNGVKSGWQCKARPSSLKLYTYNFKGPTTYFIHWKTEQLMRQLAFLRSRGLSTLKALASGEDKGATPLLIPAKNSRKWFKTPFPVLVFEDQEDNLSSLTLTVDTLCNQFARLCKTANERKVNFQGQQSICSSLLISAWLASSTPSWFKICWANSPPPCGLALTFRTVLVFVFLLRSILKFVPRMLTPSANSGPPQIFD